MVSLIIPAHNEEECIRESVGIADRFLSALGKDYEIIIVDDGSMDNTLTIAEEIAKDNPRIRVYSLPENEGKGEAVRKGVLVSRGEHCIFIDADLSYPIDQIPLFLNVLEGGAQVVLGRRRDLSRGGFRRYLAGRVFNLLARSICGVKFTDSQCGFKGFERSVAFELFRLQRMKGFSFDVEIIFLAGKKGYRIEEVPLRWKGGPSRSRVSLFRHSPRMVADLILIRLNDLLGRYE